MNFVRSFSSSSRPALRPPSDPGYDTTITEEPDSPSTLGRYQSRDERNTHAEVSEDYPINCNAPLP
jgi:hypothetical protein